MKKLAFLATAAGLFLVSNAPAGPGPGPDPSDYPPCSATVTDYCVQRDRGEPESRALDAMPPEETSGARGGPYEPAPGAAEPPGLSALLGDWTTAARSATYSAARTPNPSATRAGPPSGAR